MATKMELPAPSTLGDNPDKTGGPLSSTPPLRVPTSEQPADPGNDTLDHAEVFDLEPLEELAGPLDNEDIDNLAPILTVDLDIPTLRSVAKIGNNPQIKSRRNEALVKGLKTIDKGYLLTAGLATRRLFMAVFPDELELLDGLFSHAQTRERKYRLGPGYRLVNDDYQVLLRVLFSRKISAEDSFRLAGKTPPPLPSWAADDDLDGYYSFNDYEILGVCFRAEVENFLYTLDRYHDFRARKPRDSNHEVMQAAKEFSQRSRSGSAAPVLRKVRSSPQVEHGSPHASYRESSAEPPRQPFPRYSSVRLGHSARNNGLPKNNRRLSEILTPMATIFESSSRGTNPTGVPEEMDQMRRMGSQPPQRGRESPPHMPSGSPRNTSRGTASPTHSRREPPRRQSAPNPPDSDPSDSDDSRDSYGRRRWYRPKKQSADPPDNPNSGYPDLGRESFKDKSSSLKEPHFDLKLKYDTVPTWDGNTDTIIRWLLKINDIARESTTVFRQLGRVVPKRLEGKAEIWYWSLPIAYRAEIEENWDTLCKAFSTYFLNRKWLDRQRGRANKAAYRDYGHVNETPSEYYIRKTELLNTVYTLDDSEIIMEVMDGAPALWNTILTTQMYEDAVQFQSAIRYHEDALLKLGFKGDKDTTHRDRDRDYSKTTIQDARANLVGWTPSQEPPKFPKDDRNVSKRATPQSKGARPCRHCGSGNHWDNECRQAFKGNRAVRADLANTTNEQMEAQEEYDDLYYSLETDDDADFNK
ncbi:hypothetical protein C8R43DRAFT_1129106 [Mycena crocata]|nr:hypothetical protein C8R43DRAFT_1129106 [Mycena crocata]